MIDFGHKKVGKIQLFDLRWFLCSAKNGNEIVYVAGFLPSFLGLYKNPTKKRSSTWLFYGFSSQRKSRIFFAKSKTTKEILMVLLANLTSYNEWEFTYFFNKWSAGEPLTYFNANKVKPRCHLWQAAEPFWRW